MSRRNRRILNFLRVLSGINLYIVHVQINVIITSSLVTLVSHGSKISRNAYVFDKKPKRPMSIFFTDFVLRLVINFEIVIEKYSICDSRTTKAFCKPFNVAMVLNIFDDKNGVWNFVTVGFITLSFKDFRFIAHQRALMR